MSYLWSLRIVGFCCIAIVGVAAINLWALLRNEIRKDLRRNLRQTMINANVAGGFACLTVMGLRLTMAGLDAYTTEETARQVFWESLGSAGLPGYLIGVLAALVFLMVGWLDQYREDD